jgi:type II secretory ATPase GspE/PulE/Tfp pilus assembly ATPase PilB-like protein
MEAYDHPALGSPAKWMVVHTKRPNATSALLFRYPPRSHSSRRYRAPHIDKKSREQFEMRTHKRVIDRMARMASIDIAEKRLPQDGRIKMKISGSQIDVRICSLPAYHGENVVLRILRPDSVEIGIRGPGFEEGGFAASSASRTASSW